MFHIKFLLDQNGWLMPGYCQVSSLSPPFFVRLTFLPITRDYWNIFRSLANCRCAHTGKSYAGLSSDRSELTTLPGSDKSPHTVQISWTLYNVMKPFIEATFKNLQYQVIFPTKIAMPVKNPPKHSYFFMPCNFVSPIVQKKLWLRKP